MNTTNYNIPPEFTRRAREFHVSNEDIDLLHWHLGTDITRMVLCCFETNEPNEYKQHFYPAILPDNVRVDNLSRVDGVRIAVNYCYDRLIEYLNKYYRPGQALTENDMYRLFCSALKRSVIHEYRNMVDTSISEFADVKAVLINEFKRKFGEELSFDRMNAYADQRVHGPQIPREPADDHHGPQDLPDSTRDSHQPPEPGPEWTETIFSTLQSLHDRLNALESKFS